MKSKTAFTKTDVVVVLGCVMFLLTSLGAIGRAGRSRAKEAVCKANLKKWAKVFSLYAADNDGYNPYGNWAHSWWGQVVPYIKPDVKERKLLYCPMATDRNDPQPFKAWSYGNAPQQYGGGRYQGSYGVNPWILSFEGSSGSRFGGFDPEEWRWKRPDVAGADNVPVFGDCSGPGAASQENNIPPEFRDQISRGMGSWFLDRHDCAINMAFMDWSVRKVGLKCLWKLKWHRQFDTVNSGPVEGAAWPDGWPEWMADCPPGCD